MNSNFHFCLHDHHVFSFYVDEVDLDTKSTSPEDEDKGSEGNHVAMETDLHAF